MCPETPTPGVGVKSEAVVLNADPPRMDLLLLDIRLLAIIKSWKNLEKLFFSKEKEGWMKLVVKENCFGKKVMNKKKEKKLDMRWDYERRSRR